MGTRSLTVFWDEEGREIAVLYRQFDGYLEGHGAALAKVLGTKRLSNGIAKGCFNGMGCLAASVVASLKKEACSFYLMAAGTRDCGEEYTYHVSALSAPVLGKPVPIRVRAYHGDALLFDGTPTAFRKFLKGPVKRSKVTIHGAFSG